MQMPRVYIYIYIFVIYFYENYFVITLSAPSLYFVVSFFARYRLTVIDDMLCIEYFKCFVVWFVIKDVLRPKWYPATRLIESSFWRKRSNSFFYPLHFGVHAFFLPILRISGPSLNYIYLFIVMTLVFFFTLVFCLYLRIFYHLGTKQNN